MTRSDEMLDDAEKELPPLSDFRPGGVNDDSPEVASLGDIAADPEYAPQRVPGSRALDTAALFAAASVHAAALFALLAVPPALLGGGGRSLDAISVSIVSASALESRDASAPATVGSASGPVAPTEGQDTASADASPDKPPETNPPDPQREPERETPRETPAADNAAAPPSPAPESAPEVAPSAVDAPPPTEPVEEQKTALVEPPPRPPEPPEKPPEETAEAPSPDARQAGGLASRGVAPELPPAPAAAAALPGEVHAYGLALQEALLAVDQTKARQRLTASQARGTTVVRIAIGADGKLDRADVSSSSGRQELDELAIMLVRLAALPPVPPGLSDSARIYLIPIAFR